MTCPRCGAAMHQNCRASSANWFCRRCDLWIEINDDYEIVATNEDAGKAYILRGATGVHTRGHTNVR